MTKGSNDLTKEVDVFFDFCQLEYGVGACPAVLGQDSDAKCHNTLATCPVPDSYAPLPKPLTFVRPEDDVEANKIPSLRDLTIQASRLAGFTGKESPLGKRGKATATFKDHAWDDSLVDKYHLERAEGTAGTPAYDPLESGTFWPKFRARNRFYTGRKFVVRTGIGDDVRSRHYVIENMTGFNSTPKVVAKDPLKLADDERAQCPVASTGRLAADISETDTEFVMIPAGVGDEEYPTSGRATIGKEYVEFTRDGDTITLTERSLNGVSESHDANDTFQVAKVIEGESVSDIVYDLLVNFSPVPADVIPKDEWDAEMDFITNVYTTEIAKPTSVKDLIGELAEQAGFGIAWDDLEQKILLVAVKQPESSANTIDDDLIIADTVKVKDAVDKRISRVWTAFGQIDPVTDLDEDANYRQVAINVSSSAEDDNEYSQPRIRKIFSRWIPQFGLPVAQDLNRRLLARFQNIPRDIEFQVPRYAIDDISLGSTRVLKTRQIQNEFGEPRPVTIRVLGIEEKEDVLSIEAEEQLFIPPPDAGNVREVIIGNDVNNFNLRDAYDELYAPPEPGITVRCTVLPNVFVCSDTTTSPAFKTGAFPEGVNLILEIQGGSVISGRGGDAHDIELQLSGQDRNFNYSFDHFDKPGTNSSGGVALSADTEITIINNGIIQGGGGASTGFAGFVWARDRINSSDQVAGDLAVLVQGGAGGEPFGLGGNATYSNSFTPSLGYDQNIQSVVNGKQADKTTPGSGDRTRVAWSGGGTPGQEIYVENETNAGGEPGENGNFINFIEQGGSGYVGFDIENYQDPRGLDGSAVVGSSNVTFDERGSIIGDEV